MTDDERDAGIAPEDETSRSVIGYFRDAPDRLFGALGTLIFVAGWAAVIYLAFFQDWGPTGGSGDVFRIQLLVSLGVSVTTPSAILWGIAAYLWIQLHPAAQDASATPTTSGS